MSWRDTLKTNLKLNEGVRYHPYKDTLGNWTIGVGRNLDDLGLRDSEVNFMLENDMDAAESDVRSLVGTFEVLSDNRKAVVTELCFNMGVSRLSGFARFLGFTGNSEWENGAKELENSAWYHQVGERGPMLVNLWRQG